MALANVTTLIETGQFACFIVWPGYAASSDGRVWSCLERHGLGKGFHGGTKIVLGDTWKEMTVLKSRFGRPTVQLSRNGRGQRFFVHRLILEAFVGPCPSGMECCHKDDDPTNNCLENLRWDTRKANMVDAYANQKRGKLHRKELDLVFLLRQQGMTQQKIADQFGVRQGTISNILLGKRIHM